MKRSLLLCFLAIVGSLAGLARTVYFDRPEGVSSTTTINVYTWNSTTDEKPDGNWPGKATDGSTVSVSINGASKSLIQVDIDDKADRLIFNWNGGQTSDFVAEDNGVYNKSEIIGYYRNGKFVDYVYTGEYVRYYFLKPDSWEKVYIYSWEPTFFGGWPGTQMTLTEELKDGNTYYYVEMREDQLLQHMKFNNNQGTETGNIEGTNLVPNGIYNESGYTHQTADQLVKVEGNEVYFLNDLNWRTVYAYAWSGSDGNEILYNGPWPGNALTTTKTVNDKEVYVLDVEGAEKVIFSCYDATHQHPDDYDKPFDWEKTPDLVYTPGHIYTGSQDVIENKPEKLYVIGGGTGWDINSEDVDLTPDSEDGFIYTGDVVISGDQFRIYANHDGNWNTGSYGSGAPENGYSDVTFTKGVAKLTAVKNNKGNWKLPMSSAGKPVKFTFNFVTKEFTIYDPSVVTIREFLYGENSVVPAEKTYATKQDIIDAGDHDGLATIDLVLESVVHINRNCTEPAVFYNGTRKVFEVYTTTNLKDAYEDGKIGVFCVAGNSDDNGLNVESTFKFVFSTAEDDALAYQGENSLQIPDGFFMMSGTLEQKTMEVNGEEVTMDLWTGGTPIKGGPFVWNVTEGGRPAVDALPHDPSIEDTFTVTTTGITIKANSITGEHSHYPHIIVTDLTANEELPHVSPRAGATTFNILGLGSGRLHKVDYHFHAYEVETDPVAHEEWVRDQDANIVENTIYALTQPVMVFNPDSKFLTVEAGKGTVILYTTDGTEPDVNLLQGIATQSAETTKMVVVDSDKTDIEIQGENPTLKVKAAAAHPETGEYIVNPTVSEVPTAVAVIGAEEGETVYYNLQGVRVENPANGVFIRVRGGKAVKVTVD